LLKCIAALVINAPYEALPLGLRGVVVRAVDRLMAANESESEAAREEWSVALAVQAAAVGAGDEPCADVVAALIDTGLPPRLLASASHRFAAHPLLCVDALATFAALSRHYLVFPFFFVGLSTARDRTSVSLCLSR
jgi:hypothetical protein